MHTPKKPNNPLSTIWHAALQRYNEGICTPDAIVTSSDASYLYTIGLKPIDVLDNVEDYVKYAAPSFEDFAHLYAIRTEYFLTVQQGIWSTHCITAEDLPPKAQDFEGITWLPRILKKAEAKIKGELDAAVMYGCAGDRKFCNTYHIQPSDLLDKAWKLNWDISAVSTWLQSHLNRLSQ